MLFALGEADKHKRQDFAEDISQRSFEEDIGEPGERSPIARLLQRTSPEAETLPWNCDHSLHVRA